MIAELKDHLSRYLRAAEQGEEIEVTDRNRPIARIVPVKQDVEVSVIPPKRSFSAIRGRRISPARWAVGSTDLLLEERQGR